ncbi:MAG: patatin-like phospholipase family protein [Cytophagales bacterium]|nr:patatin-like phospholipase family protein [Cytophagales bacterium]
MNANKKIKILCVDGGGIKGVIPARILQAIEQTTQQRIFELFDIAIGTSTGGLVVLSLGVGTDNTAKYKAADLVNFYVDSAKKIFTKSFVRKIITGFSLWGAKYSNKQLDRLFQEIFDDALLSETLYAAYIPFYSLSDAEPRIANTPLAKKSDDYNFYLKNISVAAAAAPTYFAPAEFTNVSGSKQYKGTDGGIFANNPELISIIAAHYKNPSFDRDNVVIVSMGTGEVEKTTPMLTNDGIIGWLKDEDFVDLILRSESEITELIVKAAFPKHYRLQVAIPKPLSALDDAANVPPLLKCTENYIARNASIIKEVCNVITN